MQNIDLMLNIDRLHTTDMGWARIMHNLGLSPDTDVVARCREMVLSGDAKISRRGKNYYIKVRGVCITINASSFTIITAHTGL